MYKSNSIRKQGFPAMKMNTTVLRHNSIIKSYIKTITMVSLLILMITIGIKTYIDVTDKIDNLEIALEESRLALRDSKIKLSAAQIKLNESMDEIEGLNEMIFEQDAIIENMKYDNESLASEYDKLKESYDVLKEREELYDKYSYAIMYDGKRTELTYDQLKYGEKLMKEKGLNPDLLFSIGMLESKYTEKCTNSASTARGFHQILVGTGKFLWEDILGNGKGTYDHSYAFDGYKNIEMCVAYLDYLNKTRDGNIVQMMKGYSGRDLKGTYSYMNVLNTHLRKANKNIYNL